MPRAWADLAAPPVLTASYDAFAENDQKPPPDDEHPTALERINSKEWGPGFEDFHPAIN